MRLTRRPVLVLAVAALVVAVALAAAAPQAKAPAKGALKKVKIESTDPALRLKAFDQHTAMK